MSPRISLSVWAPAMGTDLRTLIPQARQAGFTGLQLDSSSNNPQLTTLSNSGRREVRRFLESQNLQLTSIRVDLGANGLGPASDADRALDAIDQYLNVATDLACPVLCIDLGRLPPAQRSEPPKPKVTPAMAGLLILPESDTHYAPEPLPEQVIPTKLDPKLVSHWQQVLGHMGEIADRYGAMLALSSALSSFAALSTIVKQVDCPWFGIDLDTASLLRDRRTLDEVFDSLGGLIRHVRARDAVKGEDRRTKPAIIGRGDVAWRDLLSHLDDTGYAQSITLDPSELPDPRTGAIAGLAQLQAFIT